MQGACSYEPHSTVATNMEGASRCQHAAVLWHALCQPICWSTFAVPVMLNQSHTPLRPPARLIQSVVVFFFPHACVHACVWVGVRACIVCCVCVGGGGGAYVHIFTIILQSPFAFFLLLFLYSTLFSKGCTTKIHNWLLSYPFSITSSEETKVSLYLIQACRCNKTKGYLCFLGTLGPHPGQQHMAEETNIPYHEIFTRNFL